MTLREAATSALAGPVVKARATSPGDAPCAPTPGRSRIERGSSFRASPTARECVAPTTAPTLESPCSPIRSSPHSATKRATCCHSRPPSLSLTSWTSPPPSFEVLTRQNTPPPCRRQAPKKGSSESRPRYGFTVTASATGFSPSRYAAAYARAVEPMSPRFASAITSRPAARAYSDACSKARMPSAPSASKNASCGFTATACGATASTMPQQKRATSPRSSTGSRSGLGSSPTTSCERFRSTSAARRSANVSVATAIDRNGNANGGGRLAPPSVRPRAQERACSALERGLQLAAGRELRHGGRGDLHALAGARVDTLTGGAGRRRELAEPREVDRVAGLEGLGHRLHEGIHGLARVTGRESALLADLLDELLLR